VVGEVTADAHHGSRHPGCCAANRLFVLRHRHPLNLAGSV
jgi:hypothetical protein